MGRQQTEQFMPQVVIQLLFCDARRPGLYREVSKLVEKRAQAVPAF